MVGRVGAKDWDFHGDRGMGLEALIRKKAVVLGGAGVIISASQSNLEVF